MMMRKLTLLLRAFSNGILPAKRTPKISCGGVLVDAMLRIGFRNSSAPSGSSVVSILFDRTCMRAFRPKENATARRELFDALGANRVR